MRAKTLFALVGLLAAVSPVHAAGDPAAGERKAATCMGCHGVPGYRNSYPAYLVPKLGGQHASYLVSALNDYKAGRRAHSTMQAQAASLTAQDIEDIAAFFAQSK